MQLPRLRAQVAFARNPGDVVGPGDWVELTTRVRTPGPGARLLRLARGDRDSSPRASVADLCLDNLDRALDPANQTGPWWPNVTPFRPARLLVDHANQTFPLFRGFVERWDDHSSLPGDAWTAVGLVDGRAWLAPIEVDVDLPRQLTGHRINSLLDLAGWPPGLRNIDPGRRRVHPATGETVGVLDLIDDAAEAEDGRFFFDAQGRATFQGRHHRLDMPAPVIEFGPGPGQVDYPGILLPLDVDDVINDARVERADGATWQFEHPGSIARYGRRSAGTMDLPIDGPSAHAWASWLVIRHAQPHRAPESVQVDAYTSATFFTQLLQAELSDLVRVVHQPPGGGPPIDASWHLEELVHDVTATTWTVTPHLSPYHGAGPWFTWGDPARGWGSGARWAP